MATVSRSCAPTPNDIHCSYLPLAHSMERALNMIMLLRGYKIGFFGGEIEKLIEDMNVIKEYFKKFKIL